MKAKTTATPLAPSPSAPVRSADLEFLRDHFGTPEMRLVMACCREAVGTSGGGWPGPRPAAFDENVFLDLCREHRLAILAHRQLARSHPAFLSPPAAQALQTEAVRLVRRQLRLSGDMLETHRAFRPAGLRHLFLKGPTLNRMLFGDETLRHSKGWRS